MAITYSGEFGEYALLHPFHQYVPLNDTDTQGDFTGTVRSIDDASIIDRLVIVGLHSRDGFTLRVYGFDDVNANRILYAEDVDPRGRTLTVKIWQLG